MRVDRSRAVAIKKKRLCRRLMSLADVSQSVMQTES